MIKVRAPINCCKLAKQNLESLGAEFSGEYEFRDIIFTKNNSLDQYIRMRIYTQNNWDTRNILIEQKDTDFRKEFNRELLAKVCLKNSQPEYEELFSYSRRGVQYVIGNNNIFVESIFLFGKSVEIQTESEGLAKNLFKLVHAKKPFQNSMVQTIHNHYFSSY